MIGALALLGGLVGVASVLSGGAGAGATPSLLTPFAAGLGTLAVGQGVFALALGAYWIWAGVAVGRGDRFARAMSTALLVPGLLGPLLTLVMFAALPSGTSGFGGIVSLVAVLLLAAPAAIIALLWAPTGSRHFFATHPCAGCRTPSVSGARFCSRCGRALPPSTPGSIIAAQVLLGLTVAVDALTVVLGLAAASMADATSSLVTSPADAATVDSLGATAAVLSLVVLVIIGVNVWGLRGLGAGRPAARLVVSAVPLGQLAVLPAVLSGMGAPTNQIVGTLILSTPLAVVLLVLLWAPSSSHRHFAVVDHEPPTTPLAVGATSGAPRGLVPVLLGALLVVLAGLTYAVVDSRSGADGPVVPVSAAPVADTQPSGPPSSASSPTSAFPAQYAGTWSGSVTQRNGTTGAVTSRYDVAITIPGNGSVATVRYPDLGCSGEHRLRSVGADGSMQVREVITSGRGRCIASVAVVLTPAGDRLTYHFESAGTAAEEGDATLSR
ncbi:zinc ribbon domain-containing protein [Actinomycetospora aeridis]|uniref:Zinc ribbon domain-containing protein n=1 Tax=Actinomycetospora aeridis TaxID=3129231 RepID=A0ABU8N683_9PSEU